MLGSTALAVTQVEALTGAVEDLAGQFALPILLERILRRAVGLLHGSAGSICTVDEAAGTYRKEVDLGVGCRQGQVFPLAEGTTGAVVARRGPVVFERYADVAGGHVGPEERDRLLATVGVPIEWAGAIIGVCVIFSTDPDRRWHDEDVDLLRVFAGHAALAIANSGLHDRAASRAQQLAVGAERDRTVAVVHDALVHTLGDLLTHVDAAGAALSGAVSGRAPDRIDGAGGTDDHLGATQHLDAIRAGILRALADTRRTMLGPSSSDGRLLHEAVDSELAWVRSTTQLRTDLVVTGDPGPIRRAAAAPVLLAVTEALSNVVTHAHATQVRVGVVYGAGHLTAIVSDDGRGFDAFKTTRAGLDRTVAAVEHGGGTVRIEALPDWGTRVRIDMPVAASPVVAVGASSHPVRVLVADPRAITRAGVVRLLSSHEPDIVVVAEVADVEDLPAQVRLTDPDVLVVGHAGQMMSVAHRTAAYTAMVVLLDHAEELPTGDERVFATIDLGIDATELARLVRAAAHRPAALAGTGRSGPGLTSREHEVGELVALGMADKQIAGRLGISAKTVEKHVGSILRKTGSANRTTLAARLTRFG